MKRTAQTLGAITALVAAALVLSLVRGRIASPSSVLPSQPLAPTIAATQVLSLTNEVFDLTYDSTADALWFATIRLDGPDELSRYDIATANVDSWAIPDTSDNGFLARVKVDGAGGVWVSEDYRMVRFDTTTLKTATIEFPIDVPDAIDGALDPDRARLPGTWISGFGFQGDRVLVARDNVPYLLEVDSSLKEAGTNKLPAGYAGASDVVALGPDAIFVIGGHTNHLLGEFDSAGRLIHEMVLGNDRLAVAGGSVLTSALSISADWSTEPVMSGVPLDLLQFAVPDPRGGITVLDPIAHRVEHIADGKVVSFLQLPVFDDCRPMPADIAPDGCLPTFGTPRIDGLVTDKSGTTWFLEQQGLMAVRLD